MECLITDRRFGVIFVPHASARVGHTWAVPLHVEVIKRPPRISYKSIVFSKKLVFVHVALEKITIFAHLQHRVGKKNKLTSPETTSLFSVKIANT